jgi:hypothetical protein
MVWAGRSLDKRRTRKAACFTARFRLHPAAMYAVLRPLLLAALFFLALGGVSAAIRAARPFPEVASVYHKWRYWVARKDHYDVLFVGTSRLYHHVIPAEFDAHVQAAAPHLGPVRSFNFGIDAMWPPEQFYLLRRILAAGSTRLRWVILDCMDIQARIDPRNERSRRTAYWHDWRHTVMAWEAVPAMYGPLHRKVHTATLHGSLLLKEWTNQGLAAEWLSYELGIEKRKKASRWDPPDEWKDTEGYERGKDEPFTGEPLAAYQARVAALRENWPPQPLAPPYYRAVAEVNALVRAAGAEPIWVITPSDDVRENFAGFPPGSVVWSYVDPHRFPELYDPSLHYDHQHLNHAGAQLFTRYLAARFAEEARR